MRREIVLHKADAAKGSEGHRLSRLLVLAAVTVSLPLLHCGRERDTAAPEPPHAAAAPVWDLMNLVRMDRERPAGVTLERRQIWHEVRMAVVGRLPAAITYPVQVPAGAFLDLAYTIGPQSPSFDGVPPVRFLIVLTDEKGIEHTLLERVVDQRAQVEDRAWLDTRMDLGPWAGHTGTLSFRADLEQPTAAAVSAVALFSAPRILQEARADEPNVLLVTIDCLRADHVHAYGYERPTTPSIDQLSTEGVRFSHAFTNAPMTLPSMAQIFTSKVLPTSADAIWLAPFVTAGVPSTAIINNLYLALWQTVDRPHRSDSFDRLVFDKFHSAREITDEAIAQLDRHPGTRFALHLHYLDAHTPYTLIPPDADVFGDPSYRGRVKQSFQDVEARADLYSAEDRQRVVDWYDAGVHSIDQNLGRLIEHLRADGRLDRTLVVVTADHGEELWDHGRFFHGRSLYDEQLHVPLVVRLPGGAHAGTVVERAVRSIDIAPAILEWAHLPIPASFAGRSLTQAMAHADEPGDALVATATGAMFPTRYGLRTPRAKLVETVTDGQRALFDLAADPAERRDVLAQEPELAALLNRQLAAARGQLWRTGYQMRVVGSGSYRLVLETDQPNHAFTTLDRTGPGDVRVELSRDARNLLVHGIAGGEPLAIRFDRQRLAATSDLVAWSGGPPDRSELRLGAGDAPVPGGPIDLLAAALEVSKEPACPPPDAGVRICLWRWPGAGVEATTGAPDDETREQLRALGYAE